MNIDFDKDVGIIVEYEGQKWCKVSERDEARRLAEKWLDFTLHAYHYDDDGSMCHSYPPDLPWKEEK